MRAQLTECYKQTAFFHGFSRFLFLQSSLWGLVGTGGFILTSEGKCIPAGAFTRHFRHRVEKKAMSVEKKANMTGPVSPAFVGTCP